MKRKRMLELSRKNENTGFICGHCGNYVEPLTNGSFRNHCPACLYSLHVDENPGDRSNTCRGLMKPIGVKNSKKGMQIVHQCTNCGEVKVNIIAEYDHQPDDMDLIIKLSVPVG